MAALPALATAADLAKRLKVAEPTAGSPEREQWDEALADASGHVRDVVGNAVTQLTSTVTLTVTEAGVLTLPGGPVTALGAVVVEDGSELTASSRWLSDARTLRLPAWPRQRVTVTYTHGWVTVPSELKRWTLVLAASILTAARRGNLGMAGNLASVAVDDARVTFASAPGEAGAGVEIPEHVAARLRATYGDGGVSVLEHR